MANGQERNRLDQFLVSQGFFASRARAQAAIRAGLVAVNGAPVTKPGALIGAADDVRAADVHNYVSRGALKLERALHAFSLDPAGCTALDLGASTGGFTEVLLRAGAARVYAVDVGRGQLHSRIKSDARVINFEGLHANALDKNAVPEAIDFIACDVSFISLRKALPFALALAAPGAKLVALVKPQFETTRADIGKGGVVDPARAKEIAEEVRDWMRGRAGWNIIGFVESPIEGGDGNREFLLGASHSG